MSLSHVRPSVTPWTAAYQDLPSMGFSRQEYWEAESEGSMSCIFCDALVVLPWWEGSLGVGRARAKALCKLGFLLGAMAVVTLSGSGAGASVARAGALKESSFSS